MSNVIEDDLIVGLDIGTSKVIAVVGNINLNNEINILGIGHQATKGLKKGVVVNIKTVTSAIQKAIEKAELMTGCHIHAVYAGITGSHIRSMNSHGSVAIKNQEISKEDIARVIDAAQAVAIPADQTLLHILPQEYLVDSHATINEPLEMFGVRLEAKAHLVTCSSNALHNLEKCIEHCGLLANEIVLGQIASSYSVLSEDEKEMGVCLVDIGAGTTDIAIFTDNAIRYTSVIPIAGNQVTNDIAIALAISTENAENLKIKYACAQAQLGCSLENTVHVEAGWGRLSRTLSQRALVDVVEPRYTELLHLLQKELWHSEFEDVLAAGVVLTGGGSKIEGIIDLAEDILKMPVRIGIPSTTDKLSSIISSPIYSTATGLLLYGIEQNQKFASHKNRKFSISSIFDRIKSYLPYYHY